MFDISLISLDHVDFVLYQYETMIYMHFIVSSAVSRGGSSI